MVAHRLVLGAASFILASFVATPAGRGAPTEPASAVLPTLEGAKVVEEMVRLLGPPAAPGLGPPDLASRARARSRTDMGRPAALDTVLMVAKEPIGEE